MGTLKAQLPRYRLQVRHKKKGLLKVLGVQEYFSMDPLGHGSRNLLLRVAGFQSVTRKAAGRGAQEATAKGRPWHKCSHHPKKGRRKSANSSSSSSKNDDIAVEMIVVLAGDKNSNNQNYQSSYCSSWSFRLSDMLSKICKFEIFRVLQLRVYCKQAYKI